MSATTSARGGTPARSGPAGGDARFRLHQAADAVGVPPANPAAHPLAKTEFYDYPGIYQQTADGDTLSRIRLEELQSDAERVHGGGDVAGLMPGCLFTLIGHPRAPQNREYLTEARR